MECLEPFRKEIQKYKEVIIYGYSDVGECVLKYIIDFDTSIKIANYSGRVRYFAHSYQGKKLREEKMGIPVKSIYELTEDAADALVIIATQEQNHGSITKILDELGFSHRLYITRDMFFHMRERVEEHRSIENTRIMQYHLNHTAKLERIRNKVCRGGKVKVFFMTHDAAVFGCESVYWQMEKDGLFEPYIYVVSRRDVEYSEFYRDVLKDVQFFKERGYRTINGYDENENPRDLHRYAPDILFYDIPKLYGSGGGFTYRMDQLNWQYLTCYVPYGMHMVDSFHYHYHTSCIRETWRFFLDTAASFKRVLRDGDFNAFNTVLSGYPKFDHYRADHGQLPEKIRNGKRTVIYAPHHSLGVSNNFATFDLYKDIMLKLVKDHPEINFVFKPHPLLPFQIKNRYENGKIDFSYEDYMNYMEEWNGLPNGLCVTQGDYIGLFIHSDCMITDCGSFIGEYLPSLHPCIYIYNPRKKRQDEVYTPLARKILDSYYVVRAKEELSEYIQDVVVGGRDDKKALRESILKSEFENFGHAGESICEHIKREIME